MAQRTSRRHALTFATVWLGQLITLTGSGLTSFALGVWVYQRTGSATQFALISLFTWLPTIVISPFAGVLVDRWDRRWSMILSESGGGLSILVIALLLYAGRLEIWHIYLATAASSVFRAFSWPAYMATITLMIPKQHLGRASGLVQMADATGRTISPLLAGVLITTIQIQGVIMLDVVSFVFALLTLLIVRFPRPEPLAEAEVEQGSMLREAIYGWKYITARPGLLGLLIYFALLNFCVTIVEVLLTPLVLSFASPPILGTVLSIASIGMLVGSLLMSVWGGPKHRMKGIFGFAVVVGVLLSLDGLQPNVPLIATATFGYLFLQPIISGCSQAIWQSKVAPAVQGRVFTIRGMISLSTVPLAYLVAGPLADGVFDPWLTFHGPLANSLGRVIGVGPGRGIGLIFIVFAFASILITALAYLYPRLRWVEDELPDVVVDEEPTPVEGNKQEPSDRSYHQPQGGITG